jgi:hypothetical protein
MRHSALVLALISFLATPSPAQPTDLGSVQRKVMQLDEDYRVAKLKNDTAALDRILADNFYEMNQNGNGRNKLETLDLWRSFTISSLSTDSFEVRVAGSTATVTGTQTENGYERMLFKRVYVNSQAGWQLLSSTQFRNPKMQVERSDVRSPRRLGSVESLVMRFDEEFRTAKLKNDANTLRRILADDFYGMNQNGNGRNKAETVDLWSSFKILSLTTDSFEVRVSGDTAVVNGTQTENGNERMLFTRVYVKGPSDWQLLSSIQFRNPKLESGHF